MSWRRFVELLGGLSSRSRWVDAFRSKGKGKGRRTPDRVLSDPKEIEAWFATLGSGKG